MKFYGVLLFFSQLSVFILFCDIIRNINTNTSFECPRFYNTSSLNDIIFTYIRARSFIIVYSVLKKKKLTFWSMLHAGFLLIGNIVIRLVTGWPIAMWRLAARYAQQSCRFFDFLLLELELYLDQHQDKRIILYNGNIFLKF